MLEEKIKKSCAIIQKSIDKFGANIGVFFSFGKDSLVCYDLINRYFPELSKKCFFLALVPEMDLIKKQLQVFTDHYPDLQFFEYLHFNSYSYLRNGGFCDPHPEIKAKSEKIKHNRDLIIKEHGIDLFLTGWKQQDGLERMVTLNAYEDQAITNYNTCYPVSHWSHFEIKLYIKMNKLPLPLKIGSGNMGGLGLDETTYKMLKSRGYYGDILKIRKLFPYWTF